MIRIRRLLVILHVAARARACSQGVVTVGVAITTLQLGVSTSDRKTYRSMIEARRLPCGGAVAVLTCLRESKGNVIRIRGFAEIRRVTPDAVGRRPFVLSSHVAAQAIERGMRSSEGVACNFGMVETSAEPGSDCMALLASAREPGSQVVRCRGLLIGCGVTGIALERKTLKLSNRGALVAAVALQRRMPTDQGKTVLVVSHGLQRDLPAIHAMASRTIGPHLPTMNIRVAIGTSSSCVRKH